MKEYQGCLVFDGDDTLWYNAYKYCLLMIKCLEIIYRDFGVNCPYFSEVYLLYEKIDKENIIKHGFNKVRFPTSWVQTYQQICKMYNRKPRKKIKKELFREASRFWQPPFFLKKGVLKVLKVLKKKNFYLVLLTVGDKEVQQVKINSTKIAKYFHQIIIVPKDKSQILVKLAQKFGRDKVWMVGDSKRTDVAAAIKAGVKVFYIPSFVWDYSNWQCDSKIYKKYVTELKSIIELLPYFGLSSKRRGYEKDNN